MDANCIFCKIIKRELPASIVYEDEICISFLDIHPISEGHILVIPKEHHDRLTDFDSKTVGHVFATGQKVLKALKKTDVNCESANLFLSDGAAAGQVVMHSHLHIVPRFKGDGQKIGFIHGAGGQMSRERFDQLAKFIKEQI